MSRQTRATTVVSQPPRLPSSLVSERLSRSQTSGVWKLPAAVTLFVPRFPRLKEWAYAGAIFNYTGAAASHLLAGDGPSKWTGPLIFAAITLGSWALRPSERRINPATLTSNPRLVAWIAPLGAIAVFLVIALLTLPKGPPPP